MENGKAEVKQQKKVVLCNGQCPHIGKHQTIWFAIVIFLFAVHSFFSAIVKHMRFHVFVIKVSCFSAQMEKTFEFKPITCHMLNVHTNIHINISFKHAKRISFSLSSLPTCSLAARSTLMVSTSHMQILCLEPMDSFPSSVLIFILLRFSSF